MKTAFICSRCADRRGLAWPNGHEAKWYLATCSCCQTEGPVVKKHHYIQKAPSDKIIAWRPHG